MAGEGREAVEDARRRERRAAVREHHPDRGGDPARLQAALAAIEARYAEPSAGPSRPEVGRGAVPPDGPVGVAARVRDGVRLVRERIPAGWPGHRRLIDLPPRRVERD